MSLDRSLLIDGLKALAAQTIVIHHLVSYGPLAAFRRNDVVGYVNHLLLSASSLHKNPD